MVLKSGVPILAGIVTVLTIIGAYLYQRRKREIIPRSWQEVGLIKKINLYPLKSGHKVELYKAECTNFGLKQTKDDDTVFQLRDRFLIVYTEREHEFRTARTYPKLLAIDVSVHDENHLAIDAPTMRTLYVKIPTTEIGNETAIKFHSGETVYTVDCGDEAGLWLSRYILEKDSGLRLGYNNAKHQRDITKTQKLLIDYYKNLSNNSTGLYADLTSVLIINQASVNNLISRLGNSTITSDNFRPNIVVDGPGLEPFCEDDWEWIKIGDVVFRNVKDCTRCIITTLNPETTERLVNREPLNTLEQYRMSKGPKELPVMGLNLEVRRTGFISVGDRVFISTAK